MSVVSSLFIFSLCLSLHACNARHLGVIDNGGLGRQLNSPSKVVETVKLNMDSTQKGAERGESIGDRSHGSVISNIQKPKESKAFRKEMKYTTEEAISGSPPLVSASNWHVPHKNGDEHPWFYSDYSQPRTRTPTHN